MCEVKIKIDKMPKMIKSKNLPKACKKGEFSLVNLHRPRLPWALSVGWRYAHGVVTTGDTPPLMSARGPGAGVWPGQTPASHRAEKTPTIGAAEAEAEAGLFWVI